MLGTLDFRSVQQKSTDVTALRAYLQQLVGEPFLHVRFSYGDELTLHFGEPQKPKLKKLAHLTEGSYVVTARASSWYFKTANGIAVTMAASAADACLPDGFVPLSTEQIERGQLAQPGVRVIAADASVVRSGATESGFACSLLLADGSSILIVPEPSGDVNGGGGADDVADWEVFTPYDRYLRVGPGLGWAYLPSRGPGSSL
ncbi:MAG TPA: hypothetical protein PK867_09465 [Pirellulales bacterium]|nr:hypothetical protein [Pirellulales bacterium]